MLILNNIYSFSSRWLFSTNHKDISREFSKAKKSKDLIQMEKKMDRQISKQISESEKTRKMEREISAEIERQLEIELENDIDDVDKK